MLFDSTIDYNLKVLSYGKSYIDYLNSETFNISFSMFVEEFRKYRAWSAYSIRELYKAYALLVKDGIVNEIKWNESPEYYQNIKANFVSNTELDYSDNFIENLIDAYMTTSAVPEVIARPVTWFNQVEATRKKLGLGENQFKKAWQKTVEIVGTFTKDSFNFAGDTIGTFLKGIFKPEVIIILIIGLVIYFMVLKK